MAEIMTNFRAQDMPGAGKVAAPAPKKVAPNKIQAFFKPEPVVEAEPVVEEVVATPEVEEAE
jgi:hypothetical protein